MQSNWNKNAASPSSKMEKNPIKKPIVCLVIAVKTNTIHRTQFKMFIITKTIIILFTIHSSVTVSSLAHNSRKWKETEKIRQAKHNHFDMRA